MDTSTRCILSAENISRSFPGVKALDNVSLQINKGEVHALMGENGAGKSTLMKILIGMYTPDSGSIFYKGNRVTFSSVYEALQAGISMIHQELLLFPELTVAENIFMGNEPAGKLFGWINKKKLNRDAAAQLERLGTGIPVNKILKTLSVAEMQLVEIARAISNSAEVIIMDEPTSALSHREVEMLFKVINELKQKGVAIIYISHKMEEILRIADVVTVMRDGKYIATRKKSELDNTQLISMIVGRELSSVFKKNNAAKGEALLSVSRISGSGFSEISFSVSKGEILGIAGLLGAGRTEMVNAIAGIEKIISGDVFLKGKKVSIRNPSDAIRNGIGLVSEDRKIYGLVLSLSVKHNITLSSLDKYSRGMFINRKKENEIADREIKELRIRTPSRDQEVNLLSGGNQQKVVLSKTLLNNADIIILDEPTRGIDIGAKSEIYDLMLKLAAEGKAIIMISSELPEILGMSDRILVMSRGKIRATLGKEATQELIMHHAMT